MKSKLPQHSEAAFKKYEDHIHVIVRNYPEPSVFKVEPKAENTFIARIRDAVRGYYINGYKSVLFTQADAAKVFKSLGGVFIFTLTEKGVWCGPPHQHRVEKPVISSLANTQIDATNLEIFQAVILLKEHGVIQDEVRFANLSNFQIRAIKASPFLEYIEPNLVI